MYFKKFLFVLIISFIVGLYSSYIYRIKGTIIVYPKFNKKKIYLDDNNINYFYKIDMHPNKDGYNNLYQCVVRILNNNF